MDKTKMVGKMRLSNSGKGFVIRLDDRERLLSVSVSSVLNLLDGSFFFANITEYPKNPSYKPEIIKIKES